MGVKKWLMKQQWRVVQIRGIWSLFYGILVLAYMYYEYIPVFNEESMGVGGPFVFAGILLLTFLVLGYIYDRVLVMWAPSQEITFERNPYQYVPSPKEHIFWFPLYSSLLDVAEELAVNNNVDTQIIDETREYFSKLEKLRPERKEDITLGSDLRKEYIKRTEISDFIREPEVSDSVEESNL